MFSSRALRPTRRAAIALPIKGPPQTFRPAISSQQRRAQQQRRQYAIRIPSLQRRSRVRSTPQINLLFKQSDVPPLDFWKEYASRQGPKDLTAETYFNTASQYCDVAVPGTSTWVGVLQRDRGIDAYTLHHTAIPLLLRSQETTGHIGMHMLMSASSLGYTPSTLSLIRILTQAENLKVTERKDMFRDPMARFRRILQNGENPDALTLQGLLLVRQGHDTQALKHFDQAIKAASRKDSAGQESMPAVRKPRWAYEGSCYHQRGRILLKQGRREEAAAAFRVVALELNLAKGHLELAKLLPHDAPERETCLLKAAQASQFEACELLAHDAIGKAMDPGVPKAERDYAAKMAYEWALVEPDVTKREKLTSLVKKEFKNAGRGGGLIGNFWGWVGARFAR